MYLYIRACIYIHVYTTTYTYIYMYIYTYVKINCIAFVNKCRVQRIHMNYTTIPGIR